MRLLLTRFSALGDVLMTVPVVAALARRRPDLDIVMVSRPAAGSVFRRVGGRVRFVGVEPRDYPGPWGLLRLSRRLMALGPDMMCDLHDVLRTKALRAALRLGGIPVAHIDKRRAARRAFLRQQPKRQQETAFERQAKALARLGLEVSLEPQPPLFTAPKRGGVGIAPFAAHEGKTYPAAQMERVVDELSRRGRSVYLFGAGAAERAEAERLAAGRPGVTSMVGRLADLAAEAEFIASLDVMVTMDSANMHLAALTPTPVVSVWGATHPLGGFMGWGQSMGNAVQETGMACRPCSIYGERGCRLGGTPCMARIQPGRIVEKVEALCG